MKWEGKKFIDKDVWKPMRISRAGLFRTILTAWQNFLAKYLIKELTTFFDSIPFDFLWNDYYNHSNEPVHNFPFIFNEVGLLHLTQKWTRAICKGAYGITELFSKTLFKRLAKSGK